MFRRHAEIFYALIAIGAVTALYAAAYAFGRTLPAASSFVGHSIGVVGFVLMLVTETLYSLRKRVTDARWGPMAGWLRFHIVTGLVGPYMVLLHTAMRFNGLAGVATLLTAVVVASGIVGRYLYTVLPRTSQLSTAQDSETTHAAGSLAARRQALASWHAVHVPLTWALFAAAFVHATAALFFATLQR